MSLIIQVAKGRSKIRAKLSKIIEARLAFFRNQPKIVNVYFISTNKIKQLNKQFLNKNEECAVLSFPLSTNYQLSTINYQEIGDIFICRDVAKKKGFSINYLLIHGLLHLSGLDHQNLSDSQKWNKIERKILTDLANKLK